MTRYYFDLRDGDNVVPDEEGLELYDIEAVRTEAAYALTDLARDVIRAKLISGGTRDLAVEVRDDHGPVMLARFQFEIQRLH